MRAPQLGDEESYTVGPDFTHFIEDIPDGTIYGELICTWDSKGISIIVARIEEGAEELACRLTRGHREFQRLLSRTPRAQRRWLRQARKVDRGSSGVLYKFDSLKMEWYKDLITT